MSIKDTWQSFFGDGVPIAYLLRKSNANVWFRIHSLPDSKRYPEDEGEMQETLRRHNTVASEVLQENAACVLFFPEYAIKKLAPIFSEVASASLFYHYEDEDADIMQYALETVWQPHKFDPVLRLVANDEICYVSWLNSESGEIFAPYDGGADLFLSSTQRRDELRARYSSWLSRHPQGL
ncbi:hypothetical protein IAD21_01939 [Abditibacteriota bacterium]|nr:hypothetical protein IAD21_01939 [Abditibacteriota bacterium]